MVTWFPHNLAPACDTNMKAVGWEDSTTRKIQVKLQHFMWRPFVGKFLEIFAWNVGKSSLEMLKFYLYLSGNWIPCNPQLSGVYCHYLRWNRPFKYIDTCIFLKLCRNEKMHDAFNSRLTAYYYNRDMLKVISSDPKMMFKRYYMNFLFTTSDLWAMRYYFVLDPMSAI
jgi:hypothetical protein